MMDAFRDFKSMWDPQGLLNPGIIVDPVPVTSPCAGPSRRARTSGPTSPTTPITVICGRR